MKHELTKKQAAAISARLLLNIYGEDIKAVATIIDAEAKVREGDNSGVSTLADALANARDFIQDLINVMIIKNNDNDTRRT